MSQINVNDAPILVLRRHFARLLASPDCQMLSRTGQRVCDCGGTLWKAISGVGKQHWLAGVLCCPHIWAGSCR